jgi:hypothetical protein
VSTPQEPPAESEVPAPAADAGAGPTLIDGPPPARALELAQPIQLPPAVPAAPPARSAPTLRAEPDFGPLRGFPARPSGAGGPPPQPFPIQPPESVQVPVAAAAALDAPHLGGTLGLDTGHAVAGAPGAELLTPFVPWPVRSLPRLLVPSTEIRDAVRGIVEHEGPVVVRRVATLYAMGVGRAALAREQRHVLNTVIYDMVRNRILEADRVARDADMGSWNVRLYGTPVTRIRERGARALLDIPISEIAALAQAMREGAPATDDVEADRILAIYGAAHASQAERSVVRKAVTVEAPADQAAMFAPTLLSVMAPEERPSSTVSRGDNERAARLLENAIEEVVNEALELGMNGLHRLGLAWEDGVAVAAIRTVVIEHMATIGLTLSERELAVRVRDKMPNASGSARGAVVDAVLARVGMQLMDEEGLAVLMAPWERARRPAPSDDDTPRQQCIHGNTLGSCTQVTCPGHYLGGKSSDTDWRNDW